MAHETSFTGENHGLQVEINNAIINAEFHLPPVRPETPPEPLSTVPFPRDLDFIDRGALLDQIVEQCSSRVPRLALVGLGGVGKSQIAVECCYRIRERDAQTWVLWVHACNDARFKQSCQDIADRLRISGRQDPAANVVRLVTDWLHDERRTWLLVLDNVDEDEFLYEAQTTPGESSESPPIASLLNHTNGSILLTTRNKRVAQKFVDSRNVFQIDAMTEDQALALLQNKLGKKEHTENLIKLAKVLECMPLAMVQATAYINHYAPRCSVSQYLEDFQNSGNRLLEYEAGHQYRDWEAENSIIVTWHLSFDHIREKYPAAACLLSLMSLFDRNGIPEKLLRHRPSKANTGKSGLEETKRKAEEGLKTAWTSGMTAAAQASKARPPFWPKKLTWKQPTVLAAFNNDEKDLESDAFIENFEENITILRDYSFVSTAKDPNVFVMHGLVQLATTRWLESHRHLANWRQRFLDILLEVFPNSEHKDWKVSQWLLPHLQFTSSQRPGRKDNLQKWALLLSRGAAFAYQAGNGAGMMQMSLQANKAFEETLGPEHLETLLSASLVATAYELCGQASEAYVLQKQLDNTCRKLLDARFCYMMSNTWKGGLKILLKPRFLTKSKAEELAASGYIAKYYCTEFPLSTTSRSMHLAMIGRLEEAETEEAAALALRKTRLGPESNLAVASRFALAPIYKDQGRIDLALAVWSQGFDIILKRDYAPDILKALNQVALLSLSASMLDLAEQALQFIVNRWEDLLRLETSHTTNGMNLLALIRQRQGKFQEAENLERMALKARRQVLGPESLSSLISMSLLAMTYKDLGMMTKPAALQENVFHINQKIGGRGHPRTLAALNDLVSTYWEQGRWQEVETLGVEVWTGYNRILASEDSDDRGLTPFNARVLAASRNSTQSGDRDIVPSIARLALSNSFANQQADINAFLMECWDLRTQSEIFDVPFFQLICLSHLPEDANQTDK